jgi:hypothetical protein
MQELLFDHQLHLGLTRIFDLARSLNLAMVRFTAEPNDHFHLQGVRGGQRSGVYSGVRATPTSFINGRILDVSYAMRSLSEAVDSARSEAWRTNYRPPTRPHRWCRPRCPSIAESTESESIRLGFVA